MIAFPHETEEFSSTAELINRLTWHGFLPREAELDNAQEELCPELERLP